MTFLSLSYQVHSNLTVVHAQLHITQQFHILEDKS
jgi:hypothetical protein